MENSKNALHKIEEEGGDDVYYVKHTKFFFVVSSDGYLRTDFYPGAGLDYFSGQWRHPTERVGADDGNIVRFLFYPWPLSAEDKSAGRDRFWGKLVASEYPSWGHIWPAQRPKKLGLYREAF